MRGGIARSLLVLVLAGMFVAACSPEKMLLPNRAPETTLFVQGPVDTVNHIVHLYWFGSDPDGSIVDFEIRMLNLDVPADTDTEWVATGRRDESGRLELLTDSLFTIFAPNGVTKPRFEVRAVDNDGERDPTPARQSFIFSNEAPTLQLVTPPGMTDTTFASVTLGWLVTDPDGDLGKAMYRVWLDGKEDEAVFTKSTIFTMPTEAFRQDGELRSGFRSIFVQPIDDGGRAGDVVSTRWFVSAPVTGNRARLLVIDDAAPSPSNPAARIADFIYLKTIADLSTLGRLSADEYTVVTLQSNQPFRSSKDIEQTFALFDAVVWYRGTEESSSTLLHDFQDGIGAYVDGGGICYIEGLALTDNYRAPGFFTRAFASKYMGTDFFFKYFSQVLGDSTAGWGNDTRSVFRSFLFQDSLQASGLVPELGDVPGLRAFAVRDTNFVALWAGVGQMRPPNDMPLAVGTSVIQPSGGRLITLTIPLVAANRFNNAPRFLTTVLESMGVLTP